MVKICCKLLAIASTLAFVSGEVAKFTPDSLTLDELSGNSGKAQTVLSDALQETGMVVVTDIPHFAALRAKVLSEAVVCNEAMEGARGSIFEDGTRRLTLAAESSMISGDGDIDVSAPECAEFKKVSKIFRKKVGDISKVFAAKVSDTFHVKGNLPSTGDEEYKTFSDITKHGQHLEHFHSYFRGKDASTDDMTVDFHTDQGLFIAFVPPLMVDKDGELTGENPGKFLVELADGDVAEAKYPKNGDVIAFMIGDGAYQYMNKRMVGGKAFRATPHAFKMPAHASEGSYRSWYGRMFLPPADAISTHGYTFGDLRELAIAAHLSDENAPEQHRVLSMGCSSPYQKARQLAEGDCAADQMYCWHRCMNFTETANPDYCASQNLKFQCGTQFNQLADPEKHGDFSPMCTNATEMATPLPTAPPRPATCKDVDLESYKKDYTGFAPLNGNMSLVWNVADGAVEGKLIYNGQAGWLAGGIASETGGLGGMLGATILMARFDKEFMPVYVEEFKIDEENSAFRYWNTTLPQTVDSKEAEVVDKCHTVLSFKTKKYGDKELDLSEGAKNKFIWGCEDPSTFEMQYHGQVNRGVAELDFTKADGGYVPPQNTKSGSSSADKGDDIKVPEGSKSEGSDGKSGASTNMIASGMIAMIATAVMFLQ